MKFYLFRYENEEFSIEPPYATFTIKDGQDLKAKFDNMVCFLSFLL